MHFSFSRLTVAVALAVATLAAAAQSASTAHLDEILSELGKGNRIGQVAVSPDGKRLAWVGGDSTGALHVAPFGELQKSRNVNTKAEDGESCHAQQLLWMPDSSALVFSADCGTAHQSDFYLERFDGHTAHRLTTLHGEIDDAAISPDGRSLAFLYVPGATRPAGALAAMKSPEGVIGEDGIEIQRVATVPIGIKQPAEPTLATPDSLHIFEFDWSPDSKSLAYVAAAPPGENNWWVAKLYTQALTGEPKAILAPTEVAGPLHALQIAVPRWSPDSKSIAFIGGLMSDQGSTGGDLWMVSATGGEPVDLTPGRPTSVQWFTWESSHSLYLNELAGGDMRMVRLHLSEVPGTSPSFDAPVFDLQATVGASGLEASLSHTADRSLFVFRASSLSAPPEIWAAHTGTQKAAAAPISRFNSGLKPVSGKSVSLDWTNEGFHIQGWLIEPRDYDPAKKYPMIVSVHGGPAAANTSRWGAQNPAAFSALGYFVLLPNPRGSFGQGERFTQANRKDFGYGDLRDIVAGVDAVQAKYPVDGNRVGLTGWSYGGFMTMFAVTQTQRFRAAVAGAGISDWQSYYGENSIGQWMIPFFGASVYDDPAVYAKSSAITYIKQAKTPTLIVVGDRDGECPAPQSFEFWHALRDQGVPTRFVVYPNEGHGFRNPAHSRDVLVRSIEWFASQMPEK